MYSLVAGGIWDVLCTRVSCERNYVATKRDNAMACCLACEQQVWSWRKKQDPRRLRVGPDECKAVDLGRTEMVVTEQVGCSGKRPAPTRIYRVTPE